MTRGSKMMIITTRTMFNRNHEIMGSQITPDREFLGRIISLGYFFEVMEKRAGKFDN
jgi:hypothetical protein